MICNNLQQTRALSFGIRIILTLKGNANFSPKYDTQESIYTDLFKELKEAEAQIKVNEAGVTGDIMLNANMAM